MSADIVEVWGSPVNKLAELAALTPPGRSTKGCGEAAAGADADASVVTDVDSASFDAGFIFTLLLGLLGYCSGFFGGVVVTITARISKNRTDIMARAI